MGFIKAFAGAFSGSLADQWKDFFTVPTGLSATVGVCSAVRVHEAQDRSSNTKGSQSVISDGSMILVPEGFALVTLENGAVTGYVSEPGGYIWRSNDVNSRSVFAGSGWRAAILQQTWERFKYGGSPFAAQRGVYVNLKEIPNNRFGTQSPVYWDDAYFNTQVGAVAHGTYTLRIDNPILFIKNLLPVECYMSLHAWFDFGDMNDPVCAQLFNEIVGSLAGALSSYVNSAPGESRMSAIQKDNIGFAQSLASIVEGQFHWNAGRGLSIVNAALLAIDYDETTKNLMAKVQQADALLGVRGNSNLQAAFADGIRAVGEHPEGGALGMGFMGMGMQTVASAIGAMQQPVVSNAAVYQPVVAPNSQVMMGSDDDEDPYEHLARLKDLADRKIISQEDFEAAKRKVLGL